MKKYTITIEINETDKSDNFIDELISEVKEDERQLQVAFDINRKASDMHKQILQDKVDELNKVLERVGVSFGALSKVSAERNKYRPYRSSVNFTNGACFTLSFRQHTSDNYNDITKYGTYAQKPKFYIYNYNHCKWSFVKEEDILNEMRGNIKAELKSN